MSCTPIQRLIFAERDGPLDSVQRAVLDEHLARCPSCQQVRSQLEKSVSSWRHSTANVSTPDATLAWYALRRTLRAPQPTWWQRATRPAKLAWIALPTATIAAVVFALFPATSPDSHVAAGNQKISEVARAEFVDVPNPAASTVVYVDNTSGWLVVWADTPGKG